MPLWWLHLLAEAEATATIRPSRPSLLRLLDYEKEYESGGCWHRCALYQFQLVDNIIIHQL
jgi:hypothetical protein